MNNFFKWKFTYMLVFSVTNSNIWDDHFQLSMQGEDIIELTSGNLQVSYVYI